MGTIDTDFTKSVEPTMFKKLINSSAGRIAASEITHPVPGPDSKSAKFLNEYLGSTMQIFSKPDRVISKGKNAHLFDLEGNKYVDFTSGIAVTSLGHSEPEIAKIIAEQSKLAVHTSNLFVNNEAPKLCTKLVSKTKEFGGMSSASNVFLCNSGTEANEAALKFARKYGKLQNPDKNEIICFNSSFHGRTMFSLSVTNNEKYQSPFTPLVPGIKKAIAGDISSVEAVISDKTAGIIIEPIQGEGGILPVPDDFLLALRKLADKYHAILIYDEVQCGMGRSGKLWAHSYAPKEAHPDILTSAKALGNGFPFGATIVSPKVNDIIIAGDHGNTYGGNPIACKVSQYVLDTIGNEEFLASVQKKAKVLDDYLHIIKDKYPEHIVGVRGRGLMTGIEFNKDPTPVITNARLRGLMILKAGKSVIRFVPALTIEDETIVEGLEILDRAIAASFD